MYGKAYKEKINEYNILVGKHEGKRPLKRFKHSWADNIKIYPEELECECGLDVSYVSRYLGSSVYIFNFCAP